MKDIQDYAEIFLRNLRPENYSNDGFQVNAQHLHDTTPSKIKINLHFEIKYRYGKEKNSNQHTNNNIVYYIELFVTNVKNYGTLLVHQIKIIAQEDEFVTLPIGIRQLEKEARDGVIFPNYL